jgi:hypothetical protein
LKRRSFVAEGRKQVRGSSANLVGVVHDLNVYRMVDELASGFEACVPVVWKMSQVRCAFRVIGQPLALEIRFTIW